MRLGIIQIAGILLVTLLLGAEGASFAQDAPSDPAAGRLLLEAERLRLAGQADAAQAELEVLVERFPETNQAQEAWLLIARGRSQRGDAQGARKAAEMLTERYPTSRFAAGGFLLLAEILASNDPSPQTLEEARTVLNRVPLLFARDRYPTLPDRHQALVMSGELSLRLGDFAGAAAAFVNAIEDEPSSPWTSRARVGLATVLLDEGDWMAAADVLQRTLATSEEPNHSEKNPEAAAAARQRLTLIHRLLVRPAAGQKPWQSARTLTLPGVELRRLVGVAAAPDGTVLVADRGLDAVIEVRPGGAVGARRSLSEPGRPWFGLGGKAYAGDGGTVRGIEDSWSQTFSAPKGNTREPLKEIAAGAQGAFNQWYLLDRAAKRVAVFVPQGGYLSTLAEGDPVDVALDGRGRVYVLDRKERKVTRYSSGGILEAAAAQRNWRKPEAVATDALGRIYVLDRELARVDIFDDNFSLLLSLGPQLPGGIELKNPVDLAIDGSGRLFIADGRLEAVVVVE